MDQDIAYEDEIKLGMTGTYTKRITSDDVERYAQVTGDYNPLHMNEDFAKTTQFKGRIAHGMISAGLISACLSTTYPGPGAVHLGQTLKFVKPVYINDTLRARVKVIDIREVQDYCFIDRCN